MIKDKIIIADGNIEQELLWEQNMSNIGKKRFESILKSAQKRKSNSTVGAGAKLTALLATDFANWVYNDLSRHIGKKGMTPRAVLTLSDSTTKNDIAEACLITLRNVIGKLVIDCPLVKLANQVGKDVEDQFKINHFKKFSEKHFKRVHEDIKKRHLTDDRFIKDITNQARESDINVPKWVNWGKTNKDDNTCFLVGEYLIRALSVFSQIEGCKIFDIELSKAKYHNTPYVLTPTVEYIQWLSEQNSEIAANTVDFLPTLIKPVNWVSPSVGGYHNPELQDQRPMVKTKSKRQKKLLQAAHKGGTLNNNYKALNLLQGTAWEVNKFVLDIMNEVILQPHPIGKLPSSVPNAMLPIPPCNASEQRPFYGDGVKRSSKELKIARENWAKKYPTEALKFRYWGAKNADIKDRELKRKGKLIQTVQTLQLARQLLKYDKFYYVYTQDFRSRVYCTCNQIGPQGSNLAKALIRFRYGTPVKYKSAIDHMYIHVAGIYDTGVGGSLEAKIQWIKDNKSKIINSINNPLEDLFWNTAKKPLLFLAAAKELVDFWQVYDKGGQEWRKFKTHQPYAQDGSCNGLQHYSAMLRDIVGAKIVNLVDSVEPSDIYTITAEIVKVYMDKVIGGQMLKEGVWVPADSENKQLADIWLNHIGIVRDVVKKPVMVLPYGGTALGNKEAIEEYIRDYITDKETESHAEGRTYVNPLDDIKGGIYRASNFLNNYVLLALTESATSAKQTMSFLKFANRVMVNSQLQPTKTIVDKGEDVKVKLGNKVQFINPLTGFPVELSYMVAEKVHINTYFAGRVRYTLDKNTDKVDSRSTGQSLPPNLIHNLDATHCIMTTVNLHNTYGVTNFAMVHDSFGVPCGHVSELHEVLRETFVDMHTKYDFILEFIKSNISSLTQKDYDQLIKRYNKQCVKGDFNLYLVEDSRHFFR